MDGSLLSTRFARRSSIDLSQVSVVACNMCSLTPPTNPVITACGHSFCWQCLCRYLRGQARSCPVCSTVLSSAINAIPYLRDNGTLILCLPTSEDLERNYDVLDWIQTNSAGGVPANGVVPAALAEPRRPSSAAEMHNHVVVFGDRNDLNCQRNYNLFLTSRIEELQWRTRRVKQALLKSWGSRSRGRKSMDL